VRGALVRWHLDRPPPPGEAIADFAADDAAPASA
jgi:hypothetical protein